MCDPFTISAAILTIGGTVAQNISQNKVVKARNDALAVERIRQQGFDREQQALSQTSQDRYKGYEGQQTARAGSLADLFTAQAEAAPPESTGIVPASDSNVVVMEEARQKAKARGETDENAKRLADVRSFGSLFGDVSRLQGRDASSIAQLGGFRRGSGNVLPFELDAASHAGDKAAFGADILRGLGSIAGMYGLTGGGTSPQVAFGQRIANTNPGGGILRLGQRWAGG